MLCKHLGYGKQGSSNEICHIPEIEKEIEACIQSISIPFEQECMSSRRWLRSIKLSMPVLAEVVDIYVSQTFTLWQEVIT